MQNKNNINYISYHDNTNSRRIFNVSLLEPPKITLIKDKAHHCFLLFASSFHAPLVLPHTCFYELGNSQHSAALKYTAQVHKSVGTP